MNQPSRPPADETATELETAIQGFEEAWQKDEQVPPLIDHFLKKAGMPASSSHLLFEELVKVDLEFRWRAASLNVERFHLDDYAQRYKDWIPPGFPSDQLVTEEYWVRQHWGDQPSIEEYVQRFPGIDALRERLRAVKQELDAEFADRSQLLHHAGVLDAPASRSPVTLPEIPGYEVTEILGRGGMAVVYKARDLALGRDVAVKMIRTGANATEDELQRFRREAEAVAQLQHPNIVAIHHVGDLQGQPFCVMELVGGGSLADKLGGAPLEPVEAATLISKLAKAIHVAHGTGIVHRDLKPANILLAPTLTAPATAATSPTSGFEPKIADFGLVKRLGLAEEQTQTGDIVGTPSYMAPEQIDGKSEISPATDVYALGTILYELLTGRPPFRGSSSLDTLDQVKNQDPVRPRELQPKVARDLDTVCLKCMEKDSARRYRTGIELADDVDRFLAGQPVLARPANFVERAVKWARRRPAVAALLAVVVLAAGTLLAVGLSYSSRLTAALKTTSIERDRADENFSDAYGAVNRMLDRAGFESMANVPGTEHVREDLLVQAVALYDKLLTRSGEHDITFARHRQQAFQHLGLVRMELDRFEEAEKDLRLALQLQQEIVSIGPATADDYRTLAQSHLNVALVLQREGRMQQAKQRFQQAIDVIVDHVESVPGLRVELGRGHNNLANLLSQIGEIDAAEERHLQAISLWKEVLDEAPNDDLRHGLAHSHHNLALLYQYNNRIADAESHYKQAIKGLQPLLDANPLVAKYHLDLAECYSALAYISSSKGESETAIAQHQQALDLRRRMTTLYPGVLSYHDMVARSHHNLATVLQQHQRFDEAVESLHAANAIRERLVRESPDSQGFQLQLAESQNTLALIYSATNKLQEAKAMFMEAIGVQVSLLEQSPDEVRRATSLAATRTNYGNLLRNLNEVDASLEQHGLAIELLKKKFEQAPDQVEVRGFLLNASGARAITLGNEKRYAEAVGDWDRVVELADDQARRGYRLWRGTILARVNYAAAVKEADSLLDSGTFSPTDQYNIACIHAVAACTVREDRDLSDADRQELRSRYQDRAIELLSDEKMHGYFQDRAVFEHFRTDADLSSLHEQSRFQSLLTRLESLLSDS